MLQLVKPEVGERLRLDGLTKADALHFPEALEIRLSSCLLGCLRPALGGGEPCCSRQLDTLSCAMLCKHCLPGEQFQKP